MRAHGRPGAHAGIGGPPRPAGAAITKYSILMYHEQLVKNKQKYLKVLIKYSDLKSLRQHSVFLKLGRIRFGLCMCLI